MRRLALVVVAGCYAPHAAPGAPCGIGGACPAGLVCSPASQTCELVAIDAAIDDGMHFDVPAPIGDAAVGPMLVAQSSNFGTGGATLAVTISTAAGDLLVMTGAAIHGPLTSVSGGGALWARAARALQNTNVEIWYGITDGSSNDVTITLTGNTQDIWMVVSEWSGIATTNPLDGAIATSGVVSPADAGMVVTANARDLLVFAVADGTPNTFGTPSPGAWSALDTIAAAGFFPTQAEWYRVTGIAGRFDPHVDETAGQWDAAIAAFRVAP
jgi:hypothetical protein